MFVKQATKNLHAIVIKDFDDLLAIPLHIVRAASAFLVSLPGLVEFNGKDVPQAGSIDD